MACGDIKIAQEYRPCIVEDKKALFHKWVNIKNLIGQAYTVGIIEYENGQVEEVTPNNIRFCDNKLKEYSFWERSKKNAKTNTKKKL